MQEKSKRNVLLPWFIGVGIIAVSDIALVYSMFATQSPAPWVPEALVAVVMPGVYLTLMYLTLKSQD